MYNDLFEGKNGFHWWFGTVESDADPLAMGRMRVRIAGWHNEDYNQLKTEQLPWAYPIVGINDWAIAGKGKGITPPPPGSRVFGFFMDGETGQKPVVLGSVPGESVVDHRRSTEYGSRPWFPGFSSIRSLFENGDNETGDIPDNADTGSSTNANLKVRDVRLEKIDEGEWVVPFSGFVSSGYDELRPGNRRHRGCDICPAGFFEQTDPGAKQNSGMMKGPAGLPVYAAAAGRVIWVQNSDKGIGQIFSDYDKTGPNGGSKRRRSFGNVIAIEHTLSTGKYVTIYAHLGVSQDPADDKPGAGISVRYGQEVEKGQQIGSVGRSHVWTSLTHLHFELRVGTGLPAAPNHRNPGIIFPEMANRHPALRKVVDKSKYNAKLNFDLDDMPLVAGKGPRS